MSAEQAAGLACGGLFLAAFFGFLLVLTLSGKPVKQPVVQPVKDPVDEAHDGYQRAQYFTEAGTCSLAAADDSPALAAGCCTAHLKVSGMNDTEVAVELALMAKSNLSDLWSLPARLADLYLVPEVSG